MTVVASAAGTAASRSHWLTRLRGWHPEWWVYAVAALAWLDLVVMTVAQLNSPATEGPTMGHHDHAGHGAMAVVPDSFVASLAEAWSHWALMVVAMMLPVVAPQVRTVAMRSLWPRRQRSAIAFVLAYTAVWVAAAAVLLAPLVALGAYPLGTPWLVAILLVAAGWQVSAPRKRLLRRCASLRLGPATGRPADLDCARAGVRSGVRCLATCGPLMLSMVASHSVLLMAGLLVVMLSERGRGPDPVRRAGRPLEAWVIVGFAAVAGLAALPLV